VRIKSAGRKGRGVFAKKQIEPGEIIEISPYIEVPDFDHDILKLTIINYYWFYMDLLVDLHGYSNLRA
jgi:hypothetical protein